MLVPGRVLVLVLAPVPGLVLGLAPGLVLELVLVLARHRQVNSRSAATPAGLTIFSSSS